MFSQFNRITNGRKSRDTWICGVLHALGHGVFSVVSQHTQTFAGECLDPLVDAGDRTVHRMFENRICGGVHEHGHVLVFSYCSRTRKPSRSNTSIPLPKVQTGRFASYLESLRQVKALYQGRFAATLNGLSP